jgi:hypothetical protein
MRPENVKKSGISHLSAKSAKWEVWNPHSAIPLAVTTPLNQCCSLPVRGCICCFLLTLIAPLCMNASSLLRLTLSVVLLLTLQPARAQMRDQELAAPRVPAGSTINPAAYQRFVHELTNTLQLQPYQVVIVRRALAAHLSASDPSVGAATAADETTSAVSPDQELRVLLSESQLARFEQWKSTLPATQQVSWIALSRE